MNFNYLNSVLILSFVSITVPVLPVLLCKWSRIFKKDGNESPRWCKCPFMHVKQTFTQSSRPLGVRFLNQIPTARNPPSPMKTPVFNMSPKAFIRPTSHLLATWGRRFDLITIAVQTHSMFFELELLQVHSAMCQVRKRRSTTSTSALLDLSWSNSVSIKTCHCDSSCYCKGPEETIAAFRSS